MPDSAIRRAVMGDRQAPYGATCSGRGVVLFRLLRSVTMDTPSICGAGGAPPANGGGAAGLAARRAYERALAAGASESWAHRPRGGRRLPGARVAAVLCAELGGASHLDLEGRGERRACDGGGIAPAHEPPRAARRPAPQLHRATGVAAGRERYLEPAHEPAGGLGQADRRPIAHLHTAARRPLGRAGQRRGAVVDRVRVRARQPHLVLARLGVDVARCCLAHDGCPARAVAEPPLERVGRRVAPAEQLARVQARHLARHQARRLARHSARRRETGVVGSFEAAQLGLFALDEVAVAVDARPSVPVAVVGVDVVRPLERAHVIVLVGVEEQLLDGGRAAVELLAADHQVLTEDRVGVAVHGHRVEEPVVPETADAHHRIPEQRVYVCLDLVGALEVASHEAPRVTAAADRRHLGALGRELVVRDGAHGDGQVRPGQTRTLRYRAERDVGGHVVDEGLARTVAAAVGRLGHVADDAAGRAAWVAAGALLLGGVHHAVLALLPHVDLLVVGAHVAGPAGLGLLLLGCRERVARVAGVALAHRTVGGDVADVVAALAHFVPLGLRHDRVARRRGHLGPPDGVLVRVGAGGVLVRELGVLIRVTALLGARAGGDLATGCVDGAVIGAVTAHAGDALAGHDAVLKLRHDAGRDAGVTVDAFLRRVERRGRRAGGEQQNGARQRDDEKDESAHGQPPQTMDHSCDPIAGRTPRALTLDKWGRTCAGRGLAVRAPGSLAAFEAEHVVAVGAARAVEGQRGVRQILDRQATQLAVVELEAAAIGGEQKDAARRQEAPRRHADEIGVVALHVEGGATHLLRGGEGRRIEPDEVVLPLGLGHPAEAVRLDEAVR